MSELSDNFQHRIKRFANLELMARQVVEGFITGLHKSPFHGFSVEFAEHRIYNPGDPTRYIDWKLYGRTQRLFVKRFEEETNLRCHLLIDNSSSMYFPDKNTIPDRINKLEFAVLAAAAISLLLSRQRDAMGLTLFSDQLELHTAARLSSVHHKMIYAELEKLIEQKASRKPKKSDPAIVLHEIAEKIHKRSLVIIFSDMMDTSGQTDNLFQALQHLRHKKHEVILFHIFDSHSELQLAYPNRPYRFIDLETQNELKINPGQIRQQYQDAMLRYHEGLKMRCLQYHIDYVAANIQDGFEGVLFEFMRKRSKLY